MNRNAEAVERGYDSIAQTYHAGRLAREAVNVEWLDGLRSFLPESGKVVDLGCGAGVPISRYFVSRGYEVTGYDLSREMLAIATRDVPGAAFHQGAIEDLRLDEGSVDLLVSFFALIHIDRSFHAELFTRMAGWLRKGGGVLFSLGADDNPDQVSDDFHGAPMVWSHFDAATNLGLLAAAGLTVTWHEVEDLGDERHLFVIARKV